MSAEPAAAEAPHRAAGHSPPRRAASVRRTSTIDTDWPNGAVEPSRMIGYARDVWTEATGAPPSVLGEGSFQITASGQREILSLESVPVAPELQRFIGARGGGHSRTLLSEIFTDQAQIGSPLYLLLDDFAGASLVAGWAWSRWRADWLSEMRKAGLTSNAGRRGKMEGVCAGFRPGSAALNADGTSNTTQSATPVPSLVNPADPQGWHAVGEQLGVGMRRARRIDVWLDDDVVRIDATFQDSATSPSGGRIAVHEFLLTASASRTDFVLQSLVVDPRILPYRECPGATPNAQRMVGTPLRNMRWRVLRELPGILGCTHLNDVLRSLADVPRLAQAVAAMGAGAV